MPVFRESPVKSVLALLALLACIFLWYRRLHAGDEAAPPPPIAAAPAHAPAPGLAPPLVAGAVAPVFATIDWADPRDPRAIYLNLQNYLLDTSAGLQIWDSNTLQLTPLQKQPANSRLLDQASMPVSIGPANFTMFAVREPESASLLLVRGERWTVEQRLALPAGFVPDAMVRLDRSTVLVCAPGAQRSLVFGERDGAIRQLAEADFLPAWLDIFAKAGVVGPLAGFPDQKPFVTPYDSGILQPLLFDTRTCRWRAQALPEPMAGGLDLVLSVRQEDSARPSIVAASWRDPVSKEAMTLHAPLVWRLAQRQWRQRKASDFPIVAPVALAGLAGGDWSFAHSAADGRFAFLSGADDRWRESTQRLPPGADFKLLYDRNDGVLALMIGAQRRGPIVRIAPGARIPEFRTDWSGIDNVVALRHGGLLMLEGHTARASMIVPGDPKAAPLASLPQAQRRSAGVELADGSVLVFGGLAPQCNPAYQLACAQRTVPGARWIPAENRWQPLATLAVPYAQGESLGGGSTDHTPYGRSDFVARGNELFYLSGNAIQWTGHPKDEASRLHRWQLDGASVPLAQTRLNRSNATLIELDDGRFAVLGGAAAGEDPAPSCAACSRLRKEEVRRAALALAQGYDAGDAGDADEAEIQDAAEAAVPACAACAAITVGEDYATARSCELSDPAGKRWSFGPWSHHAGGRAVKLANGRIFKFGLPGYSTTDAAYAAETADPALAAWTAAPPFPLPRPAAVAGMVAVGNQVLMVMETPGDRLVLWDDASRSWQVRPLPRHASWSLHTVPRFIRYGAGRQLLTIYDGSFEYLDWPFN